MTLILSVLRLGIFYFKLSVDAGLIIVRSLFPGRNGNEIAIIFGVTLLLLLNFWWRSLMTFVGSFFVRIKDPSSDDNSGFCCRKWSVSPRQRRGCELSVVIFDCLSFSFNNHNLLCSFSSSLASKWSKFENNSNYNINNDGTAEIGISRGSSSI